MVGYGLLFCVALPALLAWWARATADEVRLPVFGTPVLGVALIALGSGLLVTGVVTVWTRGGGVPMNAFPPPRLVTSGLFALLPHPIYVGFSIGVAGAAMALRSSSGLWLVAPTVALGCAALTLGYETPDLRARFGDLARPPGWLPEASDARPSLLDRLRCYLFLFVPWIALYEIVVSSGVPADAFDVQLPFERGWPIAGWTEVFYASPYLVAAAVPLLAPSRRSLRLFMIRGWIATAVVMAVYLAIPTLAPRPPFVATSWVDRLLDWERGTYPPVAALPSFHVIWAMLISGLFADVSPSARESLSVRPASLRKAQSARYLAWGWAAAVAISCITTRMHAVADVLAGVAVGVVLLRIDDAWELLRRATESIANSWCEWRARRLRIINHGFYAGIGTFACLTIVGVLTGPGAWRLILFTATATVVGAAAWAQWVEGSPRLLRPYGFYGGVAGVALASLAAPAFGFSPWLVLAAFSVGSPWVQSIGRLRCLVQGCCHGRPVSARFGISYFRPQSRVCRLTEYRGVPLHATQLYSILCNGFVALALGRLWMVGAPLHLIAGIFAILTGIGRFAEEAYRGEPQTPVIAGLRLYQWVAIASVLLGILFTALGRSGPAPVPAWNWTAPGIAALFAVVTTAAFGIDLPDSNRRFGRLA